MPRTMEPCRLSRLYEKCGVQWLWLLAAAGCWRCSGSVGRDMAHVWLKELLGAVIAFCDHCKWLLFLCSFMKRACALPCLDDKRSRIEIVDAGWVLIVHGLSFAFSLVAQAH